MNKISDKWRTAGVGIGTIVGTDKNYISYDNMKTCKIQYFNLVRYYHPSVGYWIRREFSHEE